MSDLGGRFLVGDAWWEVGVSSWELLGGRCLVEASWWKLLGGRFLVGDSWWEICMGDQYSKFW